MRILRIDNRYHLLPDVTVGRGSVCRLTITGIENDLDNVQVHFGKASDAATNVVMCQKRSGGEWYCYANGFYFLDEGVANYHITARTPEGDSRYLGGGKLRIIPSILNVDPENAPIIPEDTYVRGSNGLYYKLTAELDADGVPYIIVDPKGVTK